MQLEEDQPWPGGLAEGRGHPVRARGRPRGQAGPRRVLDRRRLRRVVRQGQEEEGRACVGGGSGGSGRSGRRGRGQDRHGVAPEPQAGQQRHHQPQGQAEEDGTQSS